MNRFFENVVLAMLAGAASAASTRHALAEPVHDSLDGGRNATSVEQRSTCEVGVFMERDIAAQALWLGQQAHDRGYADLHAMLIESPHLYHRLAETWRQFHPLSLAA